MQPLREILSVKVVEAPEDANLLEWDCPILGKRRQALILAALHWVEQIEARLQRSRDRLAPVFGPPSIERRHTSPIEGADCECDRPQGYANESLGVSTADGRDARVCRRLPMSRIPA
jgi:hypothetical protein